MLHRQTVAPELLALLDQLMIVESLQNLRLVGGTALALQLGHRESVDIDLFGNIEITDERLKELLLSIGKIEEINISRSIKQFYVNNIKLDIVNYRYSWLDPLVSIQGIHMASLRDIAAMKLSAITQRGSKKDFIDLYFLLEHYSIVEMMTFYKKKIIDGNEWLVYRSLSFFDDADVQPTPKIYVDISWEKIKARIASEVKKYSNL